MPGRLVHHYLDATALEHPDRVALTDGARRITWADMAAASRRLARALVDRGVSPGDRVLLGMERSVDAVVAMTAVMRAGGAYVPVDGKAPAERWATVAGDSAARLALVDPVTEARAADALPGIPRLALSDADTVRDADPGVEVGPDDPAYVLYTSGSTGQPKGVVISHRNVRAYIDWAVQRFAITADDVILGTAPFHFDMSVFDLYCAQATGATLAVASELLAMFPPKLVEFVESEGVTVWKGVSSLLMYLARARVLAPDRMPSLRYVLFGGESLSTQYLIQWMETYPRLGYCNAFGPTEATGISLYHEVGAVPAGPAEKIPAGRPCEGSTAAWVVDEQLQVLPTGQQGELLLGGDCISSGYLGDAERTAAVFIDGWTDGSELPQRVYRTGDLVVLRDDGVYEFAGRVDDQVKLMGYRIELGEIDHALAAVPGVRAGAAILAEDTAGDRSLVGFYEADATLVPADVLAHLRGLLSSYMLPKRLVQVDALPRSSRGKVDRPALHGLL